MVKVSIIVPIFNVENYLKECLESLVHQTLQEIEIICVNDGSTDSSPQIIDEYVKKDNRVVAIHKENSGYGASMNYGLKRASGNYIGIVESDDFVELDMFEKLYEQAKKVDADVVKSNYYAYWSKPAIKNNFVEVLKNTKYNQLVYPMHQRSIFYVRPCIWSAIYKRDFLQNNQIDFNETPGASYQDTAFSFKVWACAERVFFVPEAYLHYRRDNERSSVKSKTKIYCVCDEYASIEKFLEERPEKYATLDALKNRLKYETYCWNLERLEYSFKLDFLKHMSEEFKLAQKNNELDRDLFNYFQWKRLQQIIDSPEKYFIENFQQNKKFLNESEVDRIFNNKFSKGLYYLKVNGFKKTFEKTIDKLFFRNK